MQITVTFNSLNELKAFTEKVLVGDTGSSVDLRAATEEPDQQTPVQKMPQHLPHPQHLPRLPHPQHP